MDEHLRLNHGHELMPIINDGGIMRREPFLALCLVLFMLVIPIPMSILIKPYCFQDMNPMSRWFVCYLFTLAQFCIWGLISNNFFD
jgi:hypothetical protein